MGSRRGQINLREFFRAALSGGEPSPYGPSTLADPMPLPAEVVPQRSEPKEEQFRRPLLRVSIETGRVLEDHLREQREGSRMVRIRTSTVPERPEKRRRYKRYDWEALTPRIIQLNQEGFAASHILKTLDMGINTAAIRKLNDIIRAAGSEPHHGNRWGKRRDAPPAETKAPEGDARIAEFDPVEEALGGEAPEPVPPAPADWPKLCDQHRCDTCLHEHVCGRVMTVNINPWIACRDWRRREAS